MTNYDRDKFIDAADVLALIPVRVSQADILQMKKSGAFPSEALRVTKRVLLWQRTDVLAWIRAHWPDAPEGLPG